MSVRISDTDKLAALANDADNGSTEPQNGQATTETSESGERVKRAYTRRAQPVVKDFTDMELYALRAILDGDPNVNSGWRSHLLRKVTGYLPVAPDLSIGPDGNASGGTVTTAAQ